MNFGIRISGFLTSGGTGGGPPVIPTTPWQTLNPGETAITLTQSQFIVSIIIDYVSASTNLDFKIGTTSGGNEIFDGTISTSQAYPIMVEYFVESTLTLYFNVGFNGRTKIYTIL